ncbi:hypothetical protein HHK36_006731 [Tetracentron sinense]|uniref:Zinc-finger domain-containing protein n=1 Tax=Tetracentron sinense TaxID=13715 RepID=A0A835DPH0_TETSI|nr:hypothetical protein HHK36_006731 [Tetracentron sinense]
MGRPRTESDYENLRNARISENQARMASLGLQKSVSELQAIISSAKFMKTPVRKWHRAVHECTPLRRSNRLNGMCGQAVYGCTCLRRSTRLKGRSGDPKSEHKFLQLSDQLKGKSRECFSVEAHRNGEGEEKRPANAPFLRVYASEIRHSPDVLARRCDSKGRGSLYDPVFGICCHYCSSLCLKKRKMVPTGIAIYKAREEGYKSVAHLLMDKLQRAAKLRR